MQDRDSAGKKGSYKLYVEVGVVYSPGGVMEPKYIRLSPTGSGQPAARPAAAGYAISSG